MRSNQIPHERIVNHKNHKSEQVICGIPFVMVKYTDCTFLRQNRLQ